MTQPPTYEELYHPWELPLVVCNSLSDIVGSARRDEKSAVETLTPMFAVRRQGPVPELSLRTVDELIRWGEAEWAKRLTTDRSPSETAAIHAEVAALRDKLTGPEPSLLLERVMVGYAVVRMLEHKRAVRRAARTVTTAEQSARRKEHATRCLRRLTAAVKAIDLAREQRRKKAELRSTQSSFL